MMKRKRILLVDDERDFVKTVANYLEARGYLVSAAYDGKVALEKAKSLPDVILLDIVMPGMSGYEVLRRLRNDPVTGKLTIIMCTGKSETRSIFDAQDLDVTDYLTKPMNLDKLSSMLSRYLDNDKIRPVNI